MAIAPLFQGAKATGIAHTVRLRQSEKAVPQLKPVEHAEVVARYARQELDNDKAGGRRIYTTLGRPFDDTVL